MWSSVRRYRGRNTREDDFNCSCSCITDLIFAWCGKQCSNCCNRKREQRNSLTSEVSGDTEHSQDSKCCVFPVCLVQTSHVEQPSSADLQENYNDEGEWQTQQPEVEPDHDKNDTPPEDEGFYGYWGFLRRLRRLRPTFFRRTTEASDKDKEEAPIFTGLRRLGLWFRQLGQRVELTPSTSTTTSPSAVTTEEMFVESTEAPDEDHVAEDNDPSPWGQGPFIVFARGACGYESFDPNCCRLWQTFNYALSETRSVTDIHYSSTVVDEKRPSSRDCKIPDVAKPGCKRNFDSKPYESEGSTKTTTSVTMITVASDLETQQKTETQPSDVDNHSRHTQGHSFESTETRKDFMGIESSDVTRDIVNILGPTKDKDGVEKVDSYQVPKMLYNIPEVILTRATTPQAQESSEPEVDANKQMKALQRQKAVDSDVTPKPETAQEDGDQAVKTDILNFMIKSSPKRVPTPKIQIDGPSSTSRTSDVRKKIVRFKEPSFTHSTTKGRAVYIGTSKHASAPQRGIIDCLSMTVERRRVTVEETLGNMSISDPRQSSVHPDAPEVNMFPAEVAGGSKGVKEYVNEYSELCKSSVDQEREILRNVIDSVRECYNMPGGVDPSRDIPDVTK